MEYHGCATSQFETNEKYGKKEKYTHGQTKRCIRLECAYANAIYTISTLPRTQDICIATTRTDSEFTHFILHGIRKIKYTRKIQDTLRSDKI